MKKLLVPRLDISVSDIEQVAKALLAQPANTIGEINWAEHPSKPEVVFRIAHNSDNILLQFTVRENEILAAVTDDNGKVWTDSCVESFISFDNAHYYNAEFTCIGKALLGYRQFGETATHGAPDVMQSISRLSTLGDQNFGHIKGDTQWTLTLVIPRTAYWMSNIASFDGLRAKGNFYKCGDNLTEPHFVSWSPIGTPKPSFHQPDFFGEIEFE